ncbi:MAG: hypothetical protein Q8P44_00320 [Dehalococcoidia bacterium]|nr:hypothetical protein [Dehalococcoidia bacterium]
MNLATMRTNVRRDLKDEDAANYRWTNDEIDRCIDNALRDYSLVVPDDEKATIATVSDSRNISLSTLTDVVLIYAVEFPIDKYPAIYQRFKAYETTITMLGRETGDGNNAYVYYGKMHLVAATTWTVAVPHEKIIALGATAYALLQAGGYSVNRANVGGGYTPVNFLTWGKEKMARFEKELKRLKSRVRPAVLYSPAILPESQSTDWGP